MNIKDIKSEDIIAALRNDVYGRALYRDYCGIDIVPEVVMDTDTDSMNIVITEDEKIMLVPAGLGSGKMAVKYGQALKKRSLDAQKLDPGSHDLALQGTSIDALKTRIAETIEEADPAIFQAPKPEAGQKKTKVWEIKP